MILVSAVLFGLIPLGTLRMNLGIDLPEFHWRGKLGVISVEVSTGPRNVPVPRHAVEAVQVQASDVSHEESDSRAADFVAGWN